MTEINFEEDSEQTQVTKDDLSNITALASAVMFHTRTVSRIEEELKLAKKVLRKVQECDLPEAMLACNMETFVTGDGLKVSVKESMTASISKANKQAAAQWLINNELGALVKEDVVIGFDNGDDEGVAELIKLLTDNGVTGVATTESMNTASIKAGIKELLAQGKDVPLELFGIYFIRKAVVK